MKLLRPFLFGVMIAGAFFYFTTYRSNRGALTDWIGRPNTVEISEASSNDSLDAEEQNNISVYRKNISSVVNITSKAVTFDFFYGLVPEEGQGSGFIIDKEGHILTNYHVIADARQIEVTLHNRKKYKATIVGTDRSHDLAVVQIKVPDLTPMVLGDSGNLLVDQTFEQIRTALDHPRGDPVTLLRQDAGLASLLSASLFTSMLYGTGARNPMVLALVSSIAAIAGLIAAFLPARRAASVDPMQALRAD